MRDLVLRWGEANEVRLLNIGLLPLHRPARAPADALAASVSAGWLAVAVIFWAPKLKLI